jgi:hypothetical protein
MDVDSTLILCGVGVTCCYIQRTLAVNSGFSLSTECRQIEVCPTPAFRSKNND